MAAALVKDFVARSDERCIVTATVRQRVGVLISGPIPYFLCCTVVVASEAKHVERGQELKVILVAEESIIMAPRDPSGSRI